MKREKGWRILDVFTRRKQHAAPTLRRRLAIVNALILTFVLLILSGIVYSVVTYNLQMSLDQRLTTQGERLQAITRVWLLNGHPVDHTLFEQLAQSMQQNEFTTNDLYIKLFDVKTGQSLQHSPNL